MLYRSTSHLGSLPQTDHLRTMVALFMPDVEQQQERLRRGEAFIKPLEEMYGEAGAHALAKNDAGVKEVAERGKDADVLHFCGRIHESSIGLALDMGRASRSPLLTARVLSGAILELLPATPLVILDATAPSSEAESLRHLMLRNVFAAELFAAGGGRITILGTGVFFDRRPSRRLMDFEFFKWIVQEPRLDEVMRQIQTIDSTTALFAATLRPEQP
jgi:hypothetical protein